MRQGVLILAAGRVRSGKKKLKKSSKSRRTQNIPRNPQQPGDRNQLETACDDHVPRVSPYFPDSVDPGFVQIGLVQLSQLVKMTNVTHTHNTDRQTD